MTLKKAVLKKFDQFFDMNDERSKFHSLANTRPDPARQRRC